MNPNQDRRKPRTNANGDFVNNDIRARRILVIDENGNKQGPMDKREALQMAEEQGLDLLQVAEQPDRTAIAKIVDYGKYRYEKDKQMKKAKKNQVETKNKEVRLTVNIGEHDLETKARKAREFIEDGDRVKVSLKFRGREIVYMEQGQETLEKFFDKVSDIAKIEKKPKLNMKFLDMYIVPKN